MLFATITTLTTLLLASTSMALPSTPITGATSTSIETSLDIPDIFDAANSTADAALAKRQQGTAYAWKKVRYCQHANGGGQCVVQSFRHGICYNFDPWWNNRISSIYPERNFRCRMHLDRDCRGGSRDVGPNWSINDLKSVNMNDKMSSIDCFGQGVASG